MKYLLILLTLVMISCNNKSTCDRKMKELYPNSQIIGITDATTGQENNYYIIDGSPFSCTEANAVYLQREIFYTIDAVKRTNRGYKVIRGKKIKKLQPIKCEQDDKTM